MPPKAGVDTARRCGRCAVGAQPPPGSDVDVPPPAPVSVRAATPFSESWSRGAGTAGAAAHSGDSHGRVAGRVSRSWASVGLTSTRSFVRPLEVLGDVLAPRCHHAHECGAVAGTHLHRHALPPCPPSQALRQLSSSTNLPSTDLLRTWTNPAAQLHRVLLSVGLGPSWPNLRTGTRPH